MESLNVLVVGAGKMAARHVTTWLKIGVNAVSVTDVLPDKADELARSLGVESATDPISAVGDDFHIIDVCVPTPFHAQYVCAGLGAGKHVFVEKPLCATVEEADQIQLAASRAPGHIQVGYLFRFHPVFAQVKEWLDRGLIGSPHLALGRMGGRGESAVWKHSRAGGGGAVNEMLVHKLELLDWFLGPLTLDRVLMRETLLPVRNIGRVNYPVDAEDFVLTRLRAQEALVIIQSDMVSPAYVENIEVHGDNGSIVASVQEGAANFLFLKEGRAGMAPGFHHLEGGSSDLIAAELSDFVSKLASPPCRQVLARAVEQVKLIEAIRNVDCTLWQNEPILSN